LEAKEAAKDVAKEKKKQEQKSKEGKKAADRVVFEKKKAELCKELESNLKIFGELAKKGKQLSMLKYYFEDKTLNKSKKSRGNQVVLVQLALDKRKESKTTNDTLTDLSCQGIKAVTTASVEVKEAAV
jgi:hypothetical protein